jgi:hypothetical protein
MICGMNTTTIYQRTIAEGVDTLTIMAHIGVADGDGDEIRVIHTVDGSVVDDGIAYHGRDGVRWLQDHHDSWSVDGYELISSGSST